jgi:hypothetical protein
MVYMDLRLIILIAILIINVTSKTTAQELHTIEIDLEKPNHILSQNFKINKGDFYNFQLTGVNLNAYSITINSSDSTNSYKLKTPLFSELPITDLTGFSSQIISSLNKELTENINLSSDTLDFISEGLLRIGNDYSQIVDLILKLQQELIKLQSNFLAARSLAITTGSYSKKGVFKSQYDSILVSLNIIVSNYGSITSRYFNILENISVNENHEKNKLILEKITSIKSEISSAITKIQTSLSPVNYNKLFLEDAFYIKNNSKKYTSLPIQFNSDKSTVKISLVPRDSSYLLNNYSTSFQVESKTNKYYGTGISYYYSGLYDEQYSAIMNTDSTYHITKEDNDEKEIGNATLIKNLHLSIGVGANISDSVRPRFLLGGGFIVSGDGKHSLSIDLGFIAGHVKRKSNSFKLNENLASKPERITVSQIDTKWFLSIGYLLKL